MFSRVPVLVCLAVLALAAFCHAGPTLYLIGDSTVRNGTAGQQGWGDPLVAEFDPAKIEVVNRAIGGRSSRTFLTEKRWDAVMANLKPGDYVLMQFGHNDGGPLNDDRCRASIKGNGDESEEIVRKTDGEKETVHSYGWYLRKYAREAKGKGAFPIIASLIPRNIWKDGKLEGGAEGYPLWAEQAAAQEGVPFIGFNALLAERYGVLGVEETAKLFAGMDHTHTCAAGASFNARVMAGAIRSLEGCDLGKYLHPGGLWLPSVFSNHMVLQRGMPVPVWGRASPGAEVTVRTGKYDAKAIADDNGCWKATLQPMEPGGPFTMEVNAGGETVSISDVLVGEVWLCSGQSNMDFTLASTPKRSFSGVTDWQKEVASADHPRLRMFTAEWTLREFPQPDVAGQWKPCSPETAVDFSAVAYYFGRDLQQQLGVPVGLVTCAYGASTIEAWMRPESLQAHPQFAQLLDAFGKAKLAFRDNPKAFEEYGNKMAGWKGGKRPKNPDPGQDQHNPSVLHNGMIAPVAPYALRGAIWYQGESNLPTRSIYTDLQEALIRDWRSLWGQPEMPFYFVQLAPNKYPSPEPAAGGSLAEMREFQAKTLAVPHTGMAVTLDIGDEKDVHPRNKLDVGKRLARLALAGSYGGASAASGPVLREASVRDGRVVLVFDHAEGLHAKDGPLKQFAIAGADGKFTTASAIIERDRVIVSSPAVPTPAHVCYAWADNPAGANLFNGEGLPAAPFRIDP